MGLGGVAVAEQLRHREENVKLLMNILGHATYRVCDSRLEERLKDGVGQV